MANPKTAWKDAERVVFDRICTETKTALGKGAHLGKLHPAMVNTWALNTGGGPSEQTRGGCFGTLQTNGAIDARFKNRADAMDFMSALLSLLNTTSNFNKIKNIQWFRLAAGGMPTVVDATFQPGGRFKEEIFTCFEAHMDVELIYNTSVSYPAQ